MGFFFNTINVTCPTIKSWFFSGTFVRSIVFYPYQSKLSFSRDCADNFRQLPKQYKLQTVRLLDCQ